MPERLIDAEAFEKHIMGSKVFSQYFKELVQSLIWGENTVDAVRVVHGKWEADPCGWHCSECGGDGRSGWKYCPNCGAKMDEEDEK